MLNLKFGAASPDEIANSITTDVKSWIRGGIAGFAAIQFMLGCVSFMAKDPRKHQEGKDHMVHACLGLIGVFVATTIMQYLETKSQGWA